MKRNLTALFLVLILLVQLVPAAAAAPGKAPEQPVLSLDRTALTLEVGESELLAAELHPEDDKAELLWSSSDDGVVAVQGEGLLTAVAEGEAVVTVRTGSLEAQCAVTVKAAAAPPDFRDLKDGAYYYDSVLWAVESEITSGTSATTFAPGKTCTRGQIVTFLWRAAGCPAPRSRSNPFTDVKEGAYYYDAMLWAVETGVTAGVSKDRFAPNNTCTRGQVVTFLYRALGSTRVITVKNPFDDVAAGKFYLSPVLWAVENGVTSGVSAERFAPGNGCTRGQVVTFLDRAYHSKKAAETFDPRCYEIVADHRSWDEAAAEAALQNGHPVRLDSPEEYRFVLGLVEQAGLSDRCFALGGRQTENGWRWQDADSAPGEEALTDGWMADCWRQDRPRSGGDALWAAFLPEEGRWAWFAGPGDKPVPDRTCAFIIEYDDPNLKPAREQTVWSVTDLTVDGADCLVTLNSNGPATLRLSVLSEDREELWTVSVPAPDYAQAAVLPVRLDTMLPAYFILRAQQFDAEGQPLCDPYETIRYTKAWQDYKAMDAADFDPDRVINFDEDTTTNFGVLADDVLVITGGQSALYPSTSVTLEDGVTKYLGITGYTVENPDGVWLELKAGDKVAAKDDSGEIQLFKIGTIERQPDGSLKITPDGTGEVWDYYAYMDAELTVGGNSGEPKRVDVNPDTEAAFGTSFYVNLKDGLKAGGSAKVSCQLQIGLHWDIKWLSKDYVEVSVKNSMTTTFRFEVVAEGGNLSVGADGKKTNSADLIQLGSAPLPTGVPGLTVNAEASVPVTLDATAEVSATVERVKTSGFVYIRGTGTQTVDEKPAETTKSLALKGELSVSVGIKLKISLNYLGETLELAMSAEAGVRLTMEMAGDLLSATDAEEKHCCSLCVNGRLEVYLTVKVTLSFNIADILSGTPLDATILDISVPINPFQSASDGQTELFGGNVILTHGNVGDDLLYFSIINPVDSPYGGVMHMGPGSCQNYTYRVKLRAVDENGLQRLDVPVRLTDKTGKALDNKTAPYVHYLANGAYQAVPVLEGKEQPPQSFTVEGKARSVLVKCFGGVKVSVYDEDTGLIIPGAQVTVTHTATGASREDVTGLLGAVHLSKLRAGACTVQVSKENYLPKTVSFELEADRTAKLKVRLTPETGTILGKVIDGTLGTPIAGATLTVKTPKATLTAKSGADGSFKLEKIPVGKRTLVVTAPGYDEAQQEFTLTVDNRELDLGTIKLTRSWESVYRTVIRGVKYSNVTLADLDLDGIPELIVHSQPGSGLFSYIEKLYVYRNGQAVDVHNNEGTYGYVPIGEITLSRNAGGQLRLTAGFVFRAGYQNYSNSFCQIQMKNDVYTRTTLFTEVVEQNSNTYYIGDSQVSQAAYNNAYNNRFTGWTKSENYTTVSMYTAKQLSNAKITELFKQYTWNGTF